MNTLPIKYIKPWFIAVVATIALFAGSTRAVAQPELSIGIPQPECTGSLTTKTGTVTFEATVVVGDAFCEDLLDEFGDYNGPVDGDGNPTLSRECTGFDFSFEAFLNGSSKTINRVFMTTSSLREFHFRDPNINLGEAGGSGPIEIRIATFQNPADSGIIITDRVDTDAPVTVTGQIDLGKRKFALVTCDSTLIGPSSSVIPPPPTPQAEGECIGLGPEGFFFERTNRGLAGRVRPQDVDIFIVSRCKIGVGIGPFQGDVTFTPGIRTFVPGQVVAEARRHKPGGTSQTDTIHYEGFDIGVCADLERHHIQPADVLDENCDIEPAPGESIDPAKAQIAIDAGCSWFCLEGGCGGDTYVCLP